MRAKVQKDFWMFRGGICISCQRGREASRGLCLDILPSSVVLWVDLINIRTKSNDSTSPLSLLSLSLAPQRVGFYLIASLPSFPLAQSDQSCTNFPPNCDLFCFCDILLGFSAPIWAGLKSDIRSVLFWHIRQITINPIYLTKKVYIIHFNLILNKWISQNLPGTRMGHHKIKINKWHILLKIKYLSIYLCGTWTGHVFMIFSHIQLLQSGAGYWHFVI